MTHSEYMVNYYRTHPEARKKKNEYMKKYSKEHYPYEKRKEYMKKYHQEHKKENYLRVKKYYQLHRQEINEKRKKIHWVASSCDTNKVFGTLKELCNYMGYSEYWVRYCMKNNKKLEGYTFQKVVNK